MDNRKLFKFLYKDITEIEEMIAEKGAKGFDEFEIEFIESRFKGAKHIIQILSEKENRHAEDIRPRPVTPEAEEKPVESKSQFQPPITEEEAESLKSLSELEEELRKESEASLSQSPPQVEEEELCDENITPEEEPVLEIETEAIKTTETEVDNLVELEEEEKAPKAASHRLGDSFMKEKSVNELLGNGNNKLEYKISNSPVLSIKSSIGINDRYQYIRELFNGNAEAFSSTVNNLDKLNSIQEAVTYLQQNYKWKKNETSLKFVNLVKRRFVNE